MRWLWAGVTPHRAPCVAGPIGGAVWPEREGRGGALTPPSVGPDAP